MTVGGSVLGWGVVPSCDSSDTLLKDQRGSGCISDATPAFVHDLSLSVNSCSFHPTSQLVSQLPLKIPLSKPSK